MTSTALDVGYESTSAFIAAFWLLRIVLQVVYYDGEIRRENRVLDSLYLVSLVLLVIVFGTASLSFGR